MYKILFVDDEPSILEIGKLFLEEIGDFSVDTVPSAVDALEILKTSSYDAIISDYLMPGMDALRFLHELRSKGDITPFILLTGKGCEEIVIDAFEEGADYYLQKGDDPDILFRRLSNKIHQIIGTRQADAALHESEERFRRIFESFEDLYFQTDMNGTIILLSPSVFRISGWKEEELIGKEVTTVYLNPHERNQFITKLLKSGHIKDYELPLLKKDGTSAIASISANLLYNPDGNPSGISGTLRDITSQKKTEETLRETNSFLENLIASANGPIIVWDPGFHITRVNRACELLIGRTAPEVIGKPLHFLFPPSDKEHLIRLIKTTSAGVRWETVEIPIMHKDGEIRTVIWNSSTIYEQDGRKPIATIAQGQDITDKKHLEEEKEKAVEQIQYNFAQLSILNDGIRNPLAVILGSIELCDDPVLIKRISEQIREIDEMVNQLDKRWIHSEKILDYLQKHHQITIDTSVKSPESPLLPAVCADETVPLVEEIQAELYAILDSMDALVYVSDINTYDLLYVNRYGRALYGSVIGKKCYQSVRDSPDGPCSFCTNKHLTDGLRPTGIYQWEYYDELRNRWYDCRDQAFLWSDGRLIRLEIATDITGKKDIEELLQTNKEKYHSVSTMLRRMCDNVPDMIWAKDSGLRYLFANRALSEQFLFAKDLKEPFGKTQEYFIDRERKKHPADPNWYTFGDNCSDSDRITLESGTSGHFIESGIIRGEHHILTVYKTPFYDENGKIIGIVGSARDITKEKMAEDALRIANQKLHLLTALTRHDILNQLQAMQLSLELAMESDDPDSIARNLSRAYAAGERIEKIIVWTRDYDDLGAVTSSWVMLKTIAQSAIDKQKTGHVKIYNTIPDNFFIYTDPTIKKIFSTLFENALIHGQSLSVIRVSAEIRDQTCIIICEDDGIGIMPGKKEEIFIHNYGKNAGISLFLAREILAIHGFSIKETGLSGQGARFEITVPGSRFRQNSVTE